ncbi:MAG: hypothetical protein OHK0037_21380 [Elainellaceae cyanobacterium]
MATRFTLIRQLELLGYTSILVITLNVCFAIISPSDAFQGGVLNGVYSSKNIASSYGVLAALTFFALAQINKKFVQKWWFSFFSAIIFVLATTSKTGLVLIFLIPSITFLFSKLEFRAKYRLAIWYWIGIFIGILIVLLLGNWITLVEGIGGDPTFTGRTEIWSFLIDKISERPWLGYGRSAFWAPQTNNNILVAQRVSYYGSLLGLEITHAHNGFIDLLLDLGWVGFAIFLGSFLSVSKKLIDWIYLSVSSETIWTAVFLIFFVISNVTESWLFRNTNLIWVVYVSLCLSSKKPRINRF